MQPGLTTEPRCTADLQPERDGAPPAAAGVVAPAPAAHEALLARSLEVLDLHKVLRHCAGFAYLESGRRMLEALRPATTLAEAARLQRATSELVRLLELRGAFSLRGCHDLGDILRRAALGGDLDPFQLLDVQSTLQATRRVRDVLSRLDAGDYRFLADVNHRLHTCPELDRRIGEALNDRGEVLDSASPQLRDVRRNLRSAHDRLVARLERLMADPAIRPALQEPIITQRNGRYVLPVKQDARGQVRGVAHDESASGMTVFVEPFEVVDLANDWRRLLVEEAEEVRRVLQRLSRLVAANHILLTETMGALIDLDVALAKARQAAELGAHEPQLNSVGVIDLRDARHPLLVLQQQRGGHPVVPMSLRLGGFADGPEPGPRALVITGPNTGGKTVAIKTVGLLSLMAQCGLHVPAEPGSRLNVFERVWADVGDEQSIEQSLSTFSSHMSHIVTVLRHAGRDDLVLLDEIGAGTDPSEGSALARAILRALLQRGCITLATTHFSELKAFAQSEPGVLNASVEFDLETLAPTFRLRTGLPGSSNALEIATRLGLAPDVVEEASGLLGQAHHDAERLLRDLEVQRDQHAERERTLAARERQSEELARLRDAELAEARRLRAQAFEEARREADQEMAELRRELHRARRVVIPRPVPTAEVDEAEAALARARQRLAALPVRRAPGPRYTPIHAGDLVEVPQLSQRATVLSEPDDEGQVEVGVGSFRLRVPARDARRVGRAAPAEQPTSFQPAAGRDRYQWKDELDLRGARAEEVEPTLAAFLDGAALAHLPQVRIIHGKGTGVLRQVVRHHLEQSPHVREYHFADRHQGGEGVTVAKLAV